MDSEQPGRVEVRVLGEPGLVVDGRPVPVPSPHQQAVLVALAVAPAAAVVPAETLIDAVWGDRPPASAAATLRTLVSRLRQSSGTDGSWLRGARGGYVLDAALDAGHFAQLTAAARAARSGGDPAGAAAGLSQALGLWLGPALGRVADAAFARACAAGLEEARLAAVEELADLELELDRVGQALARLEPLVAEHPLRERAVGRLMLALYRTGRQVDALAAYRRLRETLDAELGVAPSPELRDLEMAILQQRADLTPSQRVAAPAGLPVALTPFLGREDELAAALEAVRRFRLVCLAGPGGVGKTRLALEAAGRARSRYADGVHLVDLTPLRDPALVETAVAAALSLDAGAPLCDHLRHRSLLLVVDNCEHLVDAAARLAHAVLTSCPDVHVLATSREVLGVPGEFVLRVGGLLPAEAAELFRARAAESVPGLHIGDAEAPAVARICARLDGLPLAIELAAARLRLLDVAELADRLDDRLRVLGAGPRTADARHRTLEAALDWSHDLLPGTERVALRRLSVFPGSWTLAAAEAVVGQEVSGADVLDTVGRLVDKSLVLRLPRTGAEQRYRLLETVRQYAAGKLAAAGEDELALARLTGRVLDATSDWQDAAMDGRWVLWVHEEIDDLRAALEWSSARGDEVAILRLASCLWIYWLYAGGAEARTWLERAVAVPPALAPEAAVHARIGLSYALRNLGGDPCRAEQLLRDAVDVAAAPDRPDRAAMCHYHLADLLMGRGRTAEAERHAVLALEHSRARGHAWGAWPLAMRAWTAFGSGDLDGARATLVDVTRLVRGLRPDHYLVPHICGIRALVEAAAGDAAAAREQAALAVTIARAYPARQILAMALLRAGEAAALSGDRAGARTAVAEVVVLLRDLGTRRWVAEALELVAVVVATEEPAAAATCLAAARTLRAEMHEEHGILPVMVPHVADAARQASGAVVTELPLREVLGLAREALRAGSPTVG